MIDTQSATWRTIEKSLTDELDRLRGGLETMTDPVKIHRAQGQIAQIRETLRMPQKEREPSAF
ncbi:MAG: hypothetical protein EpisKO_41590 [Epibacterium sp.]